MLTNLFLWVEFLFNSLTAAEILFFCNHTELNTARKDGVDHLILRITEA